ncbi:Cupin (plasmid) [Streptomyces sp. ADI95-16]|uniref:cupin domain-containing protein n=1 Tax=Streptomyces sp. ADI95-16 TaxID=1522758 RepID=UPI000F4385C1|nr:Cupin [Streptomyces sp. ADI95-16]
MPPIDALPVLRATTETFFHAGDEGRDAVTIGGHIDLDTTGRNLLLSALPPLMHVSATTAEAPAACWLMDRTLHEMRSADALHTVMRGPYDWAPRSGRYNTNAL